MTIKVGDLCTPSGDVIQFRYMNITPRENGTNVWTVNMNLPRVNPNVTFLCIGFLQAAARFQQSRRIDVSTMEMSTIAILLHAQLKTVTFLLAEEIEAL